ncbi:MAG: PorT family protein, partial [Bacteroidota bacterium]|nr:PorT family protein [Bacteroidota bacterium]
QPELLYNSVGAKIDDDALKANYLSIPIMIQYNPVPVFNIHAGPQIGFLLSAKADDEDIKDQYKGLDLGLGFGAGVNLPMGLGITARYVMGLANIMDDSGDADFGDVTVKNTAFQVSLTYKLFGE